jgi:hypothetical protein
MHDARAPLNQPHPISARSNLPTSSAKEDADRLSLFGDLPNSKKRKFIVVEDPAKQNLRIRVRVLLDAVNIDEIPDSFRKANSVYPRSWFPTQMQDPPPSSHGSRFFESDDEDDVEVEVQPGGKRGRGRTMVPVNLGGGEEVEVACPRMRRGLRMKEVRINELGYRMAWHQSRVFNEKSVFLQKARKSSFLPSPNEDIPLPLFFSWGQAPKPPGSLRSRSSFTAIFPFFFFPHEKRKS